MTSELFRDIKYIVLFYIFSRHNKNTPVFTPITISILIVYHLKKYFRSQLGFFQNFSLSGFGQLYVIHSVRFGEIETFEATY